MAIISLLALLLCIVLSFIKKINTGVIGFALAFLVGVYLVGMSPNEVIKGFPTSMVFTLMGIMFLFGIASANGTLGKLAAMISNVAGNRVKLIPFIFYFFSLAVSCVVGGIIGGTLICPIAMKVGKQKNIPDFIMGAAVIFGVQGGCMTPIAANGVIAGSLMSDIGMSGMFPLWLHLAISCTILFCIAFVVGGGLKLAALDGAELNTENSSFDAKQKITAVALVAVIICTAVLKTNVPLTALTASAILILLGCSTANDAINHVSWSVIVLISGVSMLVNVMTVAGGIDAASSWMASVMTPSTASSIMVLTGGAMSAVSSATGVVMPTMIPTAPAIAAQMGGAVTVQTIVTGIVIGSHVVPISPLSTMGGIVMATSNEDTDKDRLFRNLLICAILSVVACGALAITGFYGLFW